MCCRKEIGVVVEPLSVEHRHGFQGRDVDGHGCFFRSTAVDREHGTLPCGRVVSGHGVDDAGPVARWEGNAKGKKGGLPSGGSAGVPSSSPAAQRSAGQPIAVGRRVVRPGFLDLAAVPAFAVVDASILRIFVVDQ